MTDILVVDDLHSEAELMKSYLENGGYAVTSVYSGAEALEKLSEELPKVIIADLVMPEMSGLELCRKLKKNPETSEIPIIACTTKDRQVDQKWAQKQGIAAYLVKPCTQEQMLDAVKSVIN